MASLEHEDPARLSRATEEEQQRPLLPLILLPEVTVLIENPRKGSNWGPLLRCCAAFGISQIFVVGFDKCDVRGSHGAFKHVELLAFHDHKSALQALQGLGFELLGLLQGVPDNAYYCQEEEEDDHDDRQYSYAVPVRTVVNEERQETTVQVGMGSSSSSSLSSSELAMSFPVHARPFSHRTCLVVGKKAMGLPFSLARHCHKYVHIPHQGLAPLDEDEDEAPTIQTSWLSMEAGLSIVLHEFGMWAGYDRASSVYQGQKYEVEQKVKGHTEDPSQIRQEREARRVKDANQDDACLANNIFLDVNAGGGGGGNGGGDY